MDIIIEIEPRAGRALSSRLDRKLAILNTRSGENYRIEFRDESEVREWLIDNKPSGARELYAYYRAWVNLYRVYAIINPVEGVDVTRRHSYPSARLDSVVRILCNIYQVTAPRPLYSMYDLYRDLELEFIHIYQMMASERRLMRLATEINQLTTRIGRLEESLSKQLTITDTRMTNIRNGLNRILPGIVDPDLRLVVESALRVVNDPKINIDVNRYLVFFSVLDYKRLIEVSWLLLYVGIAFDLERRYDNSEDISIRRLSNLMYRHGQYRIEYGDLRTRLSEVEEIQSDLIDSMNRADAWPVDPSNPIRPVKNMREYIEEIIDQLRAEDADSSIEYLIMLTALAKWLNVFQSVDSIEDDIEDDADRYLMVIAVASYLVRIGILEDADVYIQYFGRWVQSQMEQLKDDILLIIRREAGEGLTMQDILPQIAGLILGYDLLDEYQYHQHDQPPYRIDDVRQLDDFLTTIEKFNLGEGIDDYVTILITLGRDYINNPVIGSNSHQSNILPIDQLVGFHLLNYNIVRA